jgi:hypothetical protein|nr:MAG TPA: hypothetical protein [Caudoviricetes sp.]
MENFKVGSKDFTKKIQCFKKYKDEIIESICNAATTVEDMQTALDIFHFHGVIGETADWGSEICNDLPPCVIDYITEDRQEYGYSVYYLPELIEIIAEKLVVETGKPWSESDYTKYEDALIEDIFEFVKKYKVIGIIT